MGRQGGSTQSHPAIVNEVSFTADIENHTNRSRNFRDQITVGVFAIDLCAEGWLDTSHLRGGAGPGRASCLGGATYNHQQNSSTPLKFKQIGEKVIALAKL
ncbi:hypothetical protein PUN28_014265 [Cardiocondyla obscurior]|uniref:Uncharacterized protein n=1 Tax=Cardiocondyla obscurior TaxID=286306 RepID=A0AAW2EZ73_9HYME